MPSRPSHACAQPNCPALIPSGRFCDTHRINASREYAELRGTTKERGYAGSWPKLRAQVLREDPLCRWHSDRGYTVIAAEVDHIVPKKCGGSDDRSNLQPLCKACHSAKTLKENR